MRNVLVLILLVFFLLIQLIQPKASLAESFTLYWSIQCTNNSCNAKAGGLEVFWSGDVTGGTLTGVKLPISLEQMNEISQTADQTVEKVLSKTKSKSTKSGIEQSGVGASKENTESISIAKKRSLSLQQKMGVSAKEDLTLKFFEYFVNNSYCKFKKTQSTSWFCGAGEILGLWKSGKLAEIIYAYFLHEKLKDIPTQDLEKKIANDPNADESVDIATYILNYRNPLMFNSLQLKSDYLTAVQAFYTENKYKAWNINKNGAFLRYLVDKGIIKINYEGSVGNVIQSYIALPTLPNKDKYYSEFEHEIKKAKFIEIVKKTLFVLLPVLPVLVILITVYKKKKK